MHRIIKSTPVINSKLLTHFIKHKLKITNNPLAASRLSICVLQHLNEDLDEVKYKSSPCPIVSHIQLWGAIILEACSVLIKSRFITPSLRPRNESGARMIKLW